MPTPSGLPARRPLNHSYSNQDRRILSRVKWLSQAKFRLLERRLSEEFCGVRWSRGQVSGQSFSGSIEPQSRRRPRSIFGQRSMLAREGGLPAPGTPDPPMRDPAPWSLDEVARSRGSWLQSPAQSPMPSSSLRLSQLSRSILWLPSCFGELGKDLGPVDHADCRPHPNRLHDNRRSLLIMKDRHQRGCIENRRRCDLSHGCVVTEPCSRDARLLLRHDDRRSARRPSCDPARHQQIARASAQPPHDGVRPRAWRALRHEP
jgi:hypothetical protein